MFQYVIKACEMVSWTLLVLKPQQPLIGTQLTNEIIVFSYISDSFQPEFLVDLNDSKSSMIQVRESILPPSPLPFFFGDFFLSLSLLFFFFSFSLVDDYFYLFIGNTTSSKNNSGESPE